MDWKGMRSRDCCNCRHSRRFLQSGSSSQITAEPSLAVQVACVVEMKVDLQRKITKIWSWNFRHRDEAKCAQLFPLQRLQNKFQLGADPQIWVHHFNAILARKRRRWFSEKNWLILKKNQGNEQPSMKTLRVSHNHSILNLFQVFGF